MFLKIFSPKFLPENFKGLTFPKDMRRRGTFCGPQKKKKKKKPENFGFFLQITATTASFCKVWIITLVSKKNANYFAENRVKL
jgi:hypothetical protein